MSFFAILGAVLYGVNLVLSITASALLIYKRENPVKTLSWVIVILALPYIGLICYIFLGRNFRKEKIGGPYLSETPGDAGGFGSSFGDGSRGYAVASLLQDHSAELQLQSEYVVERSAH